MRALVLLCLCAGPVGAGCFDASEGPAKAVYEGGAELEYLGREGDVLTYRTGQTTTRMKAGLWPLGSTGGGADVTYRWDTLLPDLAAVQSDGGQALVEGRMRQGTGDWQEVKIDVEVLGDGFYDWEDCRYRVIEFRKVTIVDGKKVSEGVVLYAPEAMIAFRTDQVDVASGKVTSRMLEALH
jgi:hypothetical protein